MDFGEKAMPLKGRAMPSEKAITAIEADRPEINLAYLGFFSHSNILLQVHLVQTLISVLY